MVIMPIWMAGSEGADSAEDLVIQLMKLEMETRRARVCSVRYFHELCLRMKDTHLRLRMSPKAFAAAPERRTGRKGQFK